MIIYTAIIWNILKRFKAFFIRHWTVLLWLVVPMIWIKLMFINEFKSEREEFQVVFPLTVLSGFFLAGFLIDLIGYPTVNERKHYPVLIWKWFKSWADTFIVRS